MIVHYWLVFGGPGIIFVECKTAADKKDWLKTIVAFANSTPTGLTSVLFIGVTDDGKFEERQPDFGPMQ